MEPNNDSYQRRLSSVFSQNWVRERIGAYWLASATTLIFFFSIWIFSSTLDYTPVEKQILLDMNNRPIGRQDLLMPATHNPKFRTDEVGAAEDFSKYAILTLFSYNKDDLESGRVQDAFFRFFSEDEANSTYNNQFRNLSQQKIVVSQDGIVRARVIGDLVYDGKKTSGYIGITGRTNNQTMTYKFSGKILLTVHAASDYPSLFSFTMIVQRAPIQDRFMGYQIVLLELS